MPRNRAWADTAVGGIVGATPLIQDLLTSLTPSDTITAARLVGSIYMMGVDPESVRNGLVSIDIGIGVAAEEAFVAAVLPDPDVNAEAPARGWLYKTRSHVYEQNVGGSIQHAVPGIVMFDIRTMRKVDRGRLYITFKANLVEGTDFDIRMSGLVRALCLT